MRDALVIGIACLAAIVLGAWLFFWGTGPSGPNSGLEGAVAFTVLNEGDHSGSVDERRNYRIKSAEEFAALWRLVYSTDPPVLALDFDTQEVLAVFDGTHSSGGYEIGIASVVDGDGKRAVRIVHTAPGDTCMTTEALTSPFLMVALPKSSLPLAREDIDTVRDCN